MSCARHALMSELRLGDGTDFGAVRGWSVGACGGFGHGPPAARLRHAVPLLGKMRKTKNNDVAMGACLERDCCGVTVAQA